MKHVRAGFMFLLAASWLAVSAAPPGWLLSGSKPANYDTGVDQSAAFASLPSAFLKAKADQEGFGTLMQKFGATNYLGKRVRLSGNLRSQSITRWAGLWMRVDGSGNPPKMLAFDNMQDRPIKGTTDWQRYEVVLDVPDSAVAIAFGVLLDGPGEVWLNSTEIEILSTAIPTTGHASASLPDGPRNIRFTEK